MSVYCDAIQFCKILVSRSFLVSNGSLDPIFTFCADSKYEEISVKYKLTGSYIG